MRTPSKCVGAWGAEGSERVFAFATFMNLLAAKMLNRNLVELDA